jgi:hypothetical protein
MVIGGIILLVGAAVAFSFWRANQQAMQHMAATETLSCASAAGRCEVVGAAAPGEHGTLIAPESGREVVWHKTKVVEHYHEWETDAKGERRKVDRERTIALSTSAQPFLVQDETGSIVVHPKDADVDEALAFVDRFERAGIDLGDTSLAQLAEGVLPGAPSVGRGGAGIERKEWGILPGQRLYVLAEVTEIDGDRTMARPSDCPFVISSRSEAELSASKQSGAGIAATLGVIAAVAGVVLLVVGVL